jgi:DNA-binding transcriptional MerR regulator
MSDSGGRPVGGTTVGGAGVAHRSHLSIGEVLSLLQDEFPDVTISKIRFLESQGLLDPERTPSGYRKFYDTDLQRLRWILRQQKQNFLPLKVIKDRLEESDRNGIPLDALGVIAPPGSAGAEDDDTVPIPTTRAPAHAAVTEPDAAVTEPVTPTSGRAAGRVSALGPAPTSVSLTRAELAATVGIDEDDVADLERYGLITGRAVGRETIFEGNDVIVARAAAGLLRYGVEARHLRMYKIAAEREAGFVEQIVMPIAKQRRTDARQQAVDTVDDLRRQGERLRTALLDHLLGSLAERG